jgi:mannose-6-phosphate isomerase-like protein (cupin superfamily)
MSYFVRKADSSKQIKKSENFVIEIFDDESTNFSLKYISLMNGRDPSEENLLIELNKDCSVIYTVFKGKFTFTLYENSEKEIVELKEKDFLCLTPGTTYEIQGTGELQMINMPGYTKETFLHPEKKDIILS